MDTDSRNRKYRDRLLFILFSAFETPSPDCGRLRISGTAVRRGIFVIVIGRENDMDTDSPACIIGGAMIGELMKEAAETDVDICH